MEIKNKLTGQEERRNGDNRGEKGKGQVKEHVQRTMDKHNGVGNVIGSGGWMGQGRAMGRKNGDNCN